MGLFNRVAFDREQTSRRKRQRTILKSIIASGVSLIAFDALRVLMSHALIYDDIGLLPVLLFFLFCIVAFLAIATIVKFRKDDVPSFLLFGGTLAICILIVLRPYAALYQAEILKFAVNSRYYFGDVEAHKSSLKIYNWFPGGGFSGATFVDLIYDPRGNGEWSQELNNLAAQPRDLVPGYLMNDNCGHKLDAMFGHFYVVRTAC